MKSLSFKLLLSVASAAILFSCKKNSDDIPVPAEKPVKIVRKVSSTQLDFSSYEYDAAGNVTKHISQWQNGTGGLNILNNMYEYNGNKLVRFSNEAGYATYTYNNNVIEKAEHFTSNNRKLSTLLYNFSNGKLVSVIEQIANPVEDGAKETKISYEYYTNGNVKRIDFAHRKELTDPFIINFTKIYVEYDDKKNPEPDGVIGFFVPGVVLHINNPLRVNNILMSGTPEGYVRYEYTYNTQGFPTQRKQYIATGTTEQPPITFQYVY